VCRGIMDTLFIIFYRSNGERSRDETKESKTL